jgi:hypothetical protein
MLLLPAVSVLVMCLLFITNLSVRCETRVCMHVQNGDEYLWHDDIATKLGGWDQEGDSPLIILYLYIYILLVVYNNTTYNHTYIQQYRSSFILTIYIAICFMQYVV